MKKLITICVVVAMVVASPTMVSAVLISSLVGDKDGFGLSGAPAVPADGTLWRDGLGGVFGADYRDAGDLASAPFTDIWFSDAAITYTHTYSLGGLTPISANLTIQIAGVADNRGPWDVFLNATLIGQIPTNTSVNAFQEILTYTFVVNPSLLIEADAVLLNINVPTVTDGYSINFSELNITAVPEPATICLLGLGVLSLLRKKK
jgi:hypothetical protein